MSRSNYDKPFYVDVGTSIVAVRCASNHDVVLQYDHSLHPSVIKFARDACDRMNKEAEIGKPPRNCDVGTAEEQAVRFGALCGKYYNEEYPCDKECPLASLPMIHGFPRCQAYWAQMPYEESEAKK